METFPSQFGLGLDVPFLKNRLTEATAFERVAGCICHSEWAFIKKVQKAEKISSAIRGHLSFGKTYLD